MYFRLKRQQNYKQASITSISEEDILNALPKDEDFRQSLILPSLAKQFPFLLKPDAPIVSESRESKISLAAAQNLHQFSYRVPAPAIQAMPSKPLSVLTGANASQIWHAPRQTYYTPPSAGSAQNSSTTEGKEEPTQVDQLKACPRLPIGSLSTGLRQRLSIRSSPEASDTASVVSTNASDDLSVDTERPSSAMTTPFVEPDPSLPVGTTSCVSVAENDGPGMIPSLGTLVKQHLRNLSQSTTLSENREYSAGIANDVQQFTSQKSQLGAIVTVEYHRRSQQYSAGSISVAQPTRPRSRSVPAVALSERTSSVPTAHGRHVESYVSHQGHPTDFAGESRIAEKITPPPLRNEQTPHALSVELPPLPPRNPLRNKSYFNLPKFLRARRELGTVTLVNLPSDGVLIDPRPVSSTGTLAPSTSSITVPSFGSSPASTTSTLNSFVSRRVSDTLRSNKNAKQTIKSKDISSPIFVSSTNSDPSIPIGEIDYHKIKYRHTTVA
ncbi:hypothetical protein POJ06DRAFT_65437 [Lipomyces tetrasporus]|uniref:Uncharacterized protein n=1 Tax=Lipomyces tetrasporus TaxID=54092 RepID=A0AAD7VV74_9ASCO|nr:uncharacterized protein POJ06DRAFT_65437 [Lipomyces tetrasporus]KAJ8103208.1 hypothetical protein POJ06DRAFT_65437 [Lipomyces tetrasporus]